MWFLKYLGQMVDIYQILFLIILFFKNLLNKLSQLRDTIHKITQATGIATIVKTVIPNCGCDKRQEWLNKKIPYKN